MAASLVTAFGHTLVNPTEYYMVRPPVTTHVQMYHGHCPLLTEGPFAHYYGGYQIIDHLSPVREDPCHVSKLLFLASVSFWISAFFVKSYIKIRHHTLVSRGW